MEAWLVNVFHNFGRKTGVLFFFNGYIYHVICSLIFLLIPAIYFIGSLYFRITYFILYLYLKNCLVVFNVLYFFLGGGACSGFKIYLIGRLYFTLIQAIFMPVYVKKERINKTKKYEIYISNS